MNYESRPIAVGTRWCKETRRQITIYSGSEWRTRKFTIGEDGKRKYTDEWTEWRGK